MTFKQSKADNSLTLWVYTLLLGVAFYYPSCGSAQSTPVRFLIRPAQITQAIEAFGLPVEGLQLELVANIYSSSADTALELQSVSLVDLHTAQLRVSCVPHVQCLPFYVAATWPKENPAIAIPLALQSHSVAYAAAAKATKHSVDLSKSQPREGFPGPQSAGLQPEIDVRAGSTAMLMLDGNRIHLRFKVVCLENGAAGDTIRVTTPDHKQSYRAKVISPTILKGLI